MLALSIHTTCNILLITLMVNVLPLIIMKQKTIDANYSKYLLMSIIDENVVFPISKNLDGFAKIFPVFDAIYKITSLKQQDN